jgi:hypothetical protein
VRGRNPSTDAWPGDQRQVADQIGEVSLQVREVGHVDAEVVAAHATEPDRAVATAGGDVAGFGAAAERDRDLGDALANPFGVQQRLGLAPDTVAVPIELHGRDLVDRLAAALFPD